MQFNKIGNCPKCLGNKKKDSLDMVLIGLKNVNWGKKGKGEKFERVIL